MLLFKLYFGAFIGIAIGSNSLIEGQDFVYAEHIGQQTFLIFMSLVAGLIFANVALPPKKSL